MPNLLEGNLASFPLFQLFPLLAKYRHSGTLLIETSTERRSVIFRDGFILWPRNAGVEETDPRSLLVDCATWETGSFHFRENEDPVEVLTCILVDPQILAEEAETVVRIRREMLALFPSADIVLRANDDPAAQTNINFAPDDLRILLKVGAAKTVGVLQQELGRRVEDLYPRLIELREKGLLFIDGATGAAKEPKVPSLNDVPPPVGSLIDAQRNLHPLMDQEQMVGRDASCAVHVPDASVSSRHARIERTADGFSVEDLASRNGTFVNGERVASRRLLADGDEIRIGKVLLTFNLAKKMDRVDDTAK